MAFYSPIVDILNDKPKPPLGITPKSLHYKLRIEEIGEAIVRYLNEDYVIPVEWIEEYNELVGGGKPYER